MQSITSTTQVMGLVTKIIYTKIISFEEAMSITVATLEELSRRMTKEKKSWIGIAELSSVFKAKGTQHERSAQNFPYRDHCTKRRV